MSEPVKLSRERWDSLWRGLTGHAAGAWEPKSVVIGKPLQIDGVIFLPAEYVPRDASA